MTPGQTYTANEMNDFIGGKHQGGIRYSGNFPDIKRVGIVVGGGADAICDDELHASHIDYVGEGQVGDQRLAFGNRALVWTHLNEQLVHVFRNRGRNSYQYLGPHQIAHVSTSISEDSAGEKRGSFLFRLEPR